MDYFGMVKTAIGVADQVQGTVPTGSSTISTDSAANATAAQSSANRWFNLSKNVNTQPGEGQQQQNPWAGLLDMIQRGQSSKQTPGYIDNTMPGQSDGTMMASTNGNRGFESGMNEMLYNAFS